MGYLLAAILIISTVFSGGFCRSHSFLSPVFCSQGLEGPQPISRWRPSPWYVNCVRNADGTVTARHEKCTGGLLFDPVNKICAVIRVAPFKVRPRRLFKRAADPVCDGKALSCEDSCKDLRVCADLGSGLQKITTVKCGGSTPYCEETDTSAYCVSKVPIGCDSGFTCMAEGIVPDPKNCTVYHYCYLDNSKLKDEMGYCDPGYVFSTDLEGCKLRTSSYDCHVAPCPNGASGVIPFPSEPRFYVVCNEGVASHVLKCPDGKEFTKNGICEVVCKKAGRFPNPDSKDCKGYIECLATTSSGPPYKKNLKNCLGSQTFSPTLSKCVTAPCPTTPAPPTVAPTAATVAKF